MCACPAVGKLEFGRRPQYGHWISSMAASMRDGCCGRFVDQVAGAEPFHRERRVDLVRLIPGHRPREH